MSKPEKIKTALRLDKGVWEKCKRLAETTVCSANELANLTLLEYVGIEAEKFQKPQLKDGGENVREKHTRTE